MFILKTLLSILIFTPLIIFTVRRWVFLIAALWREDDPIADRSDSHFPELLILIPVRNEIKRLPGLLRALERLVYPQDRRRIVFINDGSSDGSGTLLQDWIRDDDRAHVLTNEFPAGKAAALNQGLDHFSSGDFIVVYDADERPQPYSLRRLSQKFKKENTGFVSGHRKVANPLASMTASYIAFENITHQWVTMRGKNRLALAPASLGSNCGYRRQAVDSIGGFTPGAYLEDSDITVRLAQAGWKMKWAPNVLSDHNAERTLRGYWQQHMRWSAGFGQVSQNQTRSVLSSPNLSMAMRIELLIFAAGYLDRLFLLAGVLLLWWGVAHPAWIFVLALYFLTPFLQICAGLYLSRAPRPLWLRLPILPFFFIVDIGVSITGMVPSLAKPFGVWREM